MHPPAFLCSCLAVVSVLTGLTGLYGLGMTYGGPVAVIWGWPLVSFFTLCVALSMAEICSAYPTSGALYFWAAKLAGARWAPLASWVRQGGHHWVVLQFVAC